MKNLLILFSILLFSCKNQKIVITELNTVGKVKEIKECKKCIDGGYIYKMEINPEEKEYIYFISDTQYKIGDYLYFKTNIQIEKEGE